MSKYVLIGIPATGKSTIGKRAAEILKMPFYNTDEMACERMTPEQQMRLLSLSGVERFEREQYAIIVELAKLDKPAIIEVWPESALIPEHIKVIKKIGTIIYIKRDIESALAQVRKRKNRMFMQGLNTGHKIDMQAEAVKLYAKEISHYEALADMTLNNNGSEREAVEKLVAMIREHR
ncbi:MAG: hypothetical protein FWC26_13735 [Fibromonadales bacterium]|nr:hypothetical protein [Fibromonadales bacterium]